MVDLSVKGTLFPLKESKCYNCIYRVSRALLPLDLEEFGLTSEHLDKLGIDENEETIIVEQHSCLVLQEDMDYIVYECNFHKLTKENSLLLNSLF